MHKDKKQEDIISDASGYVPVPVDKGGLSTNASDRDVMSAPGQLPAKPERPLAYNKTTKAPGDPVHVTEINDDVDMDESLGGGFASVKGKRRSENRLLWLVVIVMSIMCAAIGVCSSVLTGYFMRKGIAPSSINSTDMQHYAAAVVEARKPAISEVSCDGANGTAINMRYAGGTVYLLTNHHMISSGGEPKVRFYGEDSYYQAKVVGYNSYFDIAVLSVVHGEVYYLDDGKVIDRNAEYREGDYTVALGNGMSMGIAAYDGIISHACDLLSYRTKTVPVMRTTSAINAGMSGGGLFDVNGNLIGLNTYRMATTSTTNDSSPEYDVEDTGFVTPVSIFYPIYKQIMEFGDGGELTRLIGTTVTQTNTSAVGAITITGKGLGFTCEYRLGKLVVTALDAGTPPAGLRVGDVITSISGVKLDPDEGRKFDICRTVGELMCFRQGSYTGTLLSLGIDRSGAAVTVSFDGYCKYAQ